MAGKKQLSVQWSVRFCIGMRGVCSLTVVVVNLRLALFLASLWSVSYLQCLMLLQVIQVTTQTSPFPLTSTDRSPAPSQAVSGAIGSPGYRALGSGLWPFLTPALLIRHTGSNWGIVSWKLQVKYMLFFSSPYPFKKQELVIKMLSFIIRSLKGRTS